VTSAAADLPTPGVALDELSALRRELAEARQQLAATGEIVRAMGTSSDLQGVLAAVVESARRLCRADTAQIYLLEDGAFEVAVAVGVSDEYRDYMTQHPIVADRGTLAGRVVLDRRAQQIPDALADAEYGRLDVQRLGGFRTTLGVPMLVEDEVIGVLSLWRRAVDPFSDRAMEIVTTFAAQAGIAIRSVDLVRALKNRTTELAVKVEQLEALRQIGQAVSSNLDLDTVLTSVVAHSVQLSHTDGGSLLEYDEGQREFRIRGAFGTDPSLLQALQGIRITLDETLVGRVCRDREPRGVPDLDKAELDVHLAQLHAAGWRSVLAVPMLHENHIVGALVVRRRRTGDFSADTIDILQTFASQSALAIVNARLFRELEHKSGELQVASRHKSEFLASMSHELRTPLNAVIGFSEVLLQRMFGDLNDKQDEYLHDILDSGRHLLELLNDVLDLSKVEAGRMELELSTFSVRSALEYSLTLVRERAAAHAIALRLEVDDSDSDDLIETDELRFRQVVLNLVTNAVKFSHDNGEVVVRAWREAGEWRVTVADSGIGVPPEDLERIFESFQQSGRHTSANEGTGLGLALCRRIVELTGGRMWVESEVGVGSVFGFSIPPVATASPPAGDLQAADVASDRGQVVVVVEDDKASLELISLFLDSAGIQVVPARNGADGLAAVRRHQPAAVVLDIRLPGMDGWHVLEELKSDPVTAPAPVVVVTILDERPQAMALGAAEYIVKPVGRESLLNALGRVGVHAGSANGDAMSKGAQ
jgi:signal transduction histidine kinase/ActR/RegA family two-component response regulator